MNTKLPLFTLKLLFPVERENRKTSNTNLGSFAEKNNPTILFWNARPTEYDTECVEEIEKSFSQVHGKRECQISPTFLLIQ